MWAWGRVQAGQAGLHVVGSGLPLLPGADRRGVGARACGGTADHRRSGCRLVAAGAVEGRGGAVLPPAAARGGTADGCAPPCWMLLVLIGALLQLALALELVSELLQREAMLLRRRHCISCRSCCGNGRGCRAIAAVADGCTATLLMIGYAG